MTFWDAGELIAAIHSLGIPHPPGTPLYVVMAHAWATLFGGVTSVARATNLLSAVATALAGAGTAWLVARRVPTRDAGWLGFIAATSAGTMTSAWVNATETEVYAVSLGHAVAILGCASIAGDASGRARARWLLAGAYLMALAPAVHLSALVVAPAAVALAAFVPSSPERRWYWRLDAALLLGGTTIAAAGVGRMQWPLVLVGLAIAGASAHCAPRGSRAKHVSQLLALTAVASSALLVMLVRASLDPAINQGDPSTWSALADVVARRQYDVAPILPRSAPVWLQIANVFQYADWQAAMAWGSGVVTSPARVVATIAWLALGVVGGRSLWRESRTLALALVVLVAAGTFGVAAYLNLKAGASLGWGILPDDAPHEARERDYFFVLGFWGWGILAGAGAVHLARRLGRPAPAALVALVLPILGNWRSADRSREPEATAARRFGAALLESAPLHSVLFLDGDNDSYPIWYLQEVEGLRRDVLPVTVPLLPARWYPAQLARRSGLRWRERPVTGARTLSEQRAALIAAAAHAARRPVAASPALPLRERALLGAEWTLRGPLFVAAAGGPDARLRTPIDSAGAARWVEGRTRWPPDHRSPTGDDVTRVMMTLLDCPWLAVDTGVAPSRRDSLEVKCNLR